MGIKSHGSSVLALISGAMLSSRGTSDEARYVSRLAHDGIRQLQDSMLFGAGPRSARESLLQVFEECSGPNWDGYGASPVTETTFRCAYALLESLPLGSPMPTFGAEPDGHLTFEWHQAPRKTLSVSVSPEGDLHFSAMIGSSKVYGTNPFFGELPKLISDLISRVTAT